MPSVVGPVMRGTMRSPISITVYFTPRNVIASMMRQPINRAPICNTNKGVRPNVSNQETPTRIQNLLKTKQTLSNCLIANFLIAR